MPSDISGIPDVSAVADWSQIGATMPSTPGNGPPGNPPVSGGSSLTIAPTASGRFPRSSSAPILNTQQFISHVTSAGERWDTLAWKYYGDATLFGPMILLNPQIPIEPVFEAGLTIGVPILVVDPSTQNQADVPPWKRR